MGQFLVFYFSLYINDLHIFIKFPSPFHFVNDTGLLAFWVNANKIPLNVAKQKLFFLKRVKQVPVC